MSSKKPRRAYELYVIAAASSVLRPPKRYASWSATKVAKSAAIEDECHSRRLPSEQRPRARGQVVPRHAPERGHRARGRPRDRERDDEATRSSHASSSSDPLEIEDVLQRTREDGVGRRKEQREDDHEGRREADTTDVAGYAREPRGARHGAGARPGSGGRRRRGTRVRPATSPRATRPPTGRALTDTPLQAATVAAAQPIVASTSNVRSDASARIAQKAANAIVLTGNQASLPRNGAVGSRASTPPRGTAR